MEIPPGTVYEVDARIVLAEVEFHEGHTQRAIDLLHQCESDLTRYATADYLALLIFGNLARYLFLVRDGRSSEDALRRSLRTLAARSGRADFAVRLLASCDAADERNGHVSGHDALPYEMAVRAIAKELSREQAALLRVQGADEDTYGLLEDFLLSRLRRTMREQARHRVRGRPP
jgi:hypothetical protein